MDSEHIRQHWTNWAQQHKTNLRATTKTPTAKRIEVDALKRAIERVAPAGRVLDVLEVGAGNGQNLLELAACLPHRFTGVDYIPEMVENAEAMRAGHPAAGRLRFLVGDVTRLDATEGLAPSYDIVFTDRCLINLETAEKQMMAIDALAARVAPGGWLVMIENWRGSYGRQNDCREALGLPRRTPDRFNLFLDEAVIRPYLESRLAVIEVEDFISLHDLVLYVLLPAVNGGKIEYDHPLVQAATTLTIAANATDRSPFGQFGQNRLFLCRKGR